MARPKLSWTAKHQPGGIYCAPACGGRCKLVDYEKACADSKTLAERMGPGWEHNVWENLGWHWSVDKGVASIRPPHGEGDDYMVFFNSRIKQVVTRAKTPEDAVGFAIQEARGAALQLSADCDALLEDT